METTILLEKEIQIPSPEEFFKTIYETAFPKAARYIQHKGGDLEDAKDIFHDALIIYYEKCILGKFKIEKTAEGYLIGITKNLWLQKTGKGVYEEELKGVEHFPFINKPTLNDKKLLGFLMETGKKCLKLLHMYYNKQMGMKKIAMSLGYKSERSATVQKFKCIEKIRKTIHQKSLSYEDFFE